MSELEQMHCNNDKISFIFHNSDLAYRKFTIDISGGQNKATTVL